MPNDTTHRIVIDGGTTNTRAWAVVGQTIVAHEKTMMGARDSAREGSSAKLKAAVHDLVERASAQACTHVADWRPECIVAAGMITSPLGLAEVPHIEAPAGIEELAAHTHRLTLPDVSTMPIWLIPGVRCGPTEPDDATVSQVDVMRGEETLGVGLVTAGLLEPPALLLSVGSHWKLVEIDKRGRIATSTTTLSGELLHVLRTQTVLAASVDQDMPDRLDLDAVRRGVLAQRQHGLPRAAFHTRLLDRVRTSSPQARLSFLIGVIVGNTLDHWRDLLADRTVALIGAGPLCDVWRDALDQTGRACGRVVSEEETAIGFIAGLTAIADQVQLRV